MGRLDKASLIGGVLRLVIVTGHLIVHLAHKRPHIVHFFLPASYLIGRPRCSPRVQFAS